MVIYCFKWLDSQGLLIPQKGNKQLVATRYNLKGHKTFVTVLIK